MRTNDKLYLDILKIGRTSVPTGLSYVRLQAQLRELGYDLENPYIELVTRVWYFDSFHHAATDHRDIGFEELDKHVECEFVMKGDACLKLLAHRNSVFNNRLTLYSVILSGIALIASIIAIIISTIYY